MKIKECLLLVFILMFAFSCNPKITKSKVEVNDGKMVYLSNASGLVKIAEEIITGEKDYKGITISLKNDIDLKKSSFKGIGDNTTHFFGTFDGAGYKIINLNIDNTSSYTGFIRVLGDGGVVKNLTIEGSVKGSSFVGGIVGEMKGSSIIENCTNKALVTSTSQYIGGIVGSVYALKDGENPQIISNRNSGTIDGLNFVGGVVGHIPKGKIEACNNNGDVKAGAQSYIYAGGIAGYIKESKVTITNTLSTGKVKGAAASDANRYGQIEK